MNGDGGRDDRALVRAIAAGDRLSLGDLYDRHAATLIGLGLRILGDRVQVEDVLHDVFIEVWRGAHAYDSERGSVRTWLAVRMRSRCLDRRKSAGVRLAVSLEHDTRTEEPTASHDADGSRLRSALHELGEDQRRVVVLSYFEGLSAREIAAQLDIPIGTVKSRMAAAVRALRSRLAQEET